MSNCLPLAWRLLLVAAPLLVWMGAPVELAGADGETPGVVSPPPPSPAPPAASAEDVEFTVTVLKRETRPQDVPASMTLLTADDLRDGSITSVHDAAARVPNLLMQEFTARKLSFPFVRGIGSGPLNPSVTTCIDGVPQLHANSSNVELFDIERIEFVRGPQSTLYGRNTLGGVINIETHRPSLTTSAARAGISLGNYNLVDARLATELPVAENQIALGLAGGYRARDGYTLNRVGGDDLDFRRALFGRAQALWQFAPAWRARLAVFGEAARDGDYALSDLAGLRKTPHRVSHDYEGRTERDVLGGTLSVKNADQALNFTSITGFQFWHTRDKTDLDTTATDLIVRTNEESMSQWTQEFRLASAQPVTLTRDLRLNWLAGLFFFHSDYGQDAVNSLSDVAALGVGVPFPFQDISRAELDDQGLAVFGQASLLLTDRWELAFGLRFDQERKQAQLDSSTSPAIAPFTSQSLKKNYSRLIPQGSLAFHLTPEAMLYLQGSNGFKAGGFNANAPGGKDAFDPEFNWTFETGFKSTWFDDRLTLNADLFYIHWEQLQLDVPNTLIPGRFFVDNVGTAISRGGELELSALPWQPLRLFAGAGFTDARFLAGSTASGAAVGGNFLPYAPSVTWHFGGQLSAQLSSELNAFVGAQAQGVGRYFYDGSNAAKQSPYGLVNLNAGVRTAHWSLSAYTKNLFDVDYVPLAFPYSAGFAPSGYVGESGAPATYGATLEIGL